MMTWIYIIYKNDNPDQLNLIDKALFVRDRSINDSNNLSDVEKIRYII